jgi:hypothetical protein
MVNQQRGHQKGSAPRAGHTNYTTAEEIPTGEEVLAGTFSLNEHPVIILFEGPEKATRGGGGEWEPIKIPRGNSTYIPKSIRCRSLLTRPKPHNYRKTIGHRNRLETTAETQIDAGKKTCETDDKNQIKNQFMTSQTFHRTAYRRVQETTD